MGAAGAGFKVSVPAAFHGLKPVSMASAVSMPAAFLV